VTRPAALCRPLVAMHHASSALEDEPDVKRGPVASETCSAHSGPTARPLLDRLRYHTRNIVAAIESAPRSRASLLPTIAEIGAMAQERDETPAASVTAVIAFSASETIPLRTGRKPRRID
jgi:hypothetical protein